MRVIDDLPKLITQYIPKNKKHIDIVVNKKLACSKWLFNTPMEEIITNNQIYSVCDIIVDDEYKIEYGKFDWNKLPEDNIVDKEKGIAFMWVYERYNHYKIYKLEINDEFEVNFDFDEENLFF